MNYSTRDGVCSTQRQRECEVRVGQGAGGEGGRVVSTWDFHVKTGTEDLGPIQEGDGEILSSQVPSALRRTSHSA